MKNFRKTALTGFSILAFSTLCPTHQAHAFATSADIVALKVATEKAISDAAKNTMKSITSVGDSTVQALLDFSTQMSSNNAQAQKFQANMADTQDQRAVQLKVEEARNDAQKSATSGASLCNNITGAASTQNLERLVRAWRMNATQTMMAYGEGHLNGHKDLASGNTLVDLYESDHCANSATALDYQVGRCSQGPSGTPTQKGTAASMGVDGIIDAADDQNADLILNATDMTPEQQKAMSRFIPLVSDPLPVGQSVAASKLPTEERKQLFRQLDSLRLKKSIVQSIFSGLAAENMNLSGTTGTNAELQQKANDWAESTAAKTAGYNKTCVNGTCKYFPNGLTAHAAMELESKYWYYNLTYGIFASAEGQAPSQKDLNEMMAFNVVMNYKKYQLMREMDASLASILSILTQQQQESLSR